VAVKKDPRSLRNYVRYMDEGLKILSRMPVKDPKVKVTLEMVAATVDALRKTLDRKYPDLILLEGGANAD